MSNRSEKHSGTWIAYFVLLLSSLLYGLNVITAAIVSPLIPPMALAVLRGFLGFLVLLPLAWKQLVQVRLTRHDLGSLFLLGLFGIAVAYFTFLWGMQKSTASNASIIFATGPAVTNLLLAVFWHEKPSRSEVIGILLSFFGLLLVIAQGSLKELLTLKVGLGDVILFGNVLCVAIYSILGQTASKKFSALVISVYTLFFGTLLLAPVGGWQLLTGNWHLNWFDWALTIYMGTMVTGFAIYLNMEGIKRIGTGKAAIFSNLMPIFGVLFSIFLLGEHMFWYHWVGFGLTLLGIVLSVGKQPQVVVKNPAQQV